jgi:hypothetical protein
MILLSPSRQILGLVPETGPKSLRSTEILTKGNRCMRTAAMHRHKDSAGPPTSDSFDLLQRRISDPTWMMFNPLYETKILNQILKQ